MTTVTWPLAVLPPLTELSQTIEGGPPTPEEPPGDCYRTALASLLGCSSPTDVPHFVELSFWCREDGFGGWHTHRLARQWMRDTLDLDLICVDPEAAAASGATYLASVRSVRGPWNHSVVAQQGQVIHDPSGRLDLYRSAPILGAEMVVAPYDPDPDELIRLWVADS